MLCMPICTHGCAEALPHAGACTHTHALAHTSMHACNGAGLRLWSSPGVCGAHGRLLPDRARRHLHLPCFLHGPGLSSAPLVPSIQLPSSLFLSVASHSAGEAQGGPLVLCSPSHTGCTAAAAPAIVLHNYPLLLRQRSLCPSLLSGSRGPHTS